MILLIFAVLAAQAPSPDVQEKIAPVFEQARSAEREGRLAEALELYDRVLQLAPGIAEVWANKGLVLDRMDRPAEALKAFVQASRLKPALVTPHLYAGIEHLRLKQPERAVQTLEAALRLDPSNSQARLTMARARLALNSYAAAVQTLEAIQKPDAEVWRELGSAYLQWSAALTREVVESGSVYGKLLRAEFSATNGKLEVAQLRYREAMSLLSPGAAAEIPLDPATLRIVAAPKGPADSAVAEWQAGHYKRSLEMFLKAAPKNPRALYWLGLNCRALARESFLRALEREPDSWQAHLLMADTAAQAGDEAAALAEYEKAVALEPGEPQPRLAQLKYLTALQRTAEAAAKAREAVKLFPSNAELNYRYGLSLAEAGQVKEAVPYLERAAEFEPARIELAYAYGELGDARKAIEALRPALVHDDDGSLHYKIAGWYRETGQAELARQALAETTRLKARRMQQDQEVLKGAEPRR